jgi:hypothetical protein
MPSILQSLSLSRPPDLNGLAGWLAGWLAGRLAGRLADGATGLRSVTRVKSAKCVDATKTMGLPDNRQGSQGAAEAATNRRCVRCCQVRRPACVA